MKGQILFLAAVFAVIACGTRDQRQVKDNNASFVTNSKSKFTATKAKVEECKNEGLEPIDQSIKKGDQVEADVTNEGFLGAVAMKITSEIIDVSNSILRSKVNVQAGKETDSYEKSCEVAGGNKLKCQRVRDGKAEEIVETGCKIEDEVKEKDTVVAGNFDSVSGKKLSVVRVTSVETGEVVCVADGKTEKKGHGKMITDTLRSAEVADSGTPRSCYGGAIFSTGAIQLDNGQVVQKSTMEVVKPILRKK
jgi:hypothetical protein